MQSAPTVSFSAGDGHLSAPHTMHRTKLKNAVRRIVTSRPLRRPIPPARDHDACTVSTLVKTFIVPVNAMVNALSCPDHCTFAPLAALTCTYIYTQLVCKLTIPKNDPHSNRVVVGRGWCTLSRSLSLWERKRPRPALSSAQRCCTEHCGGQNEFPRS